MTARGYQGGAHQFYVDGSPVVADAFFGGAWHTVLIGSLRAGGKGLFALDVTDPANIKLLWEIGVDQEPDLGYSFPNPRSPGCTTASGPWLPETVIPA